MAWDGAFVVIKGALYSKKEKEMIIDKMARYFNQTWTLFRDKQKEIYDPEVGLFVIVREMVRSGELRVNLEILYSRLTVEECAETYDEMRYVSRGNKKLNRAFCEKFYPNSTL